MDIILYSWEVLWYTDELITINQEDCKMAQRFKAGRVEHVSGVG